MESTVAFGENQQSECEGHIRSELGVRGVSPDLTELIIENFMNASVVVEPHNEPSIDDDAFTPGTLELVRRRKCWVIRNEDLDILGTLAKFAAPVAGGGAAVALLAGASVTAPAAAAIGGTFAFLASIFLNSKRKGVTLDHLSIRVIEVLKERPGGSSVMEVTERLAFLVGEQFSIEEVDKELTRLAKAQMDSSGTTVAVAFERDGLWFSTA
jgi:hypothetical protein